MTPRYGYTVCRGVPNTNTVPVPVGTRDLITAGIPVPVPNPTQADGQTEVLNQSLEISLCAYVGPSRNDWVNYLDALALSYNTTPHTTTGFAPAYLLRGYIPTTKSTLVHHPDGIARPATESGSHNLGNVGNSNETSLHPAALEISEAFHATRCCEYTDIFPFFLFYYL